MFWFLRKSLKVGPFRVNFSKSGIGCSFGVKGARIGTGPRGPYISGGRGGIYFRHSLNPMVAQRPVGMNYPISIPSSYCTQCGSVILQGNHFCIQCGKLVPISSGPSLISANEQEHDHYIDWGVLILITLMVFILIGLLIYL